MRARSVAIVTLLAALAAGCGDDAIPTTDPGHTPATVTSGPSSNPPEPAGDDIGSAFRTFARGGRLPPMADQVELYLGNALTGVLTADQARDRSAWATCTELGSYAGASCPISPLALLRGQPAVAHVEPPAGRPAECLATYGPLPPDLRELDRTILVPPNDAIDDCDQDFAIQLITNDEGELVAVSTLLGER